MKKIFKIRERKKVRSQRKLRLVNFNSRKLRMSVFVGNQIIFAQLINDMEHNTVCSFSTEEKDFSVYKGYNMKGAEAAGEMAGDRFNNFLKQSGNTYKGIYIDRCGRKFHGRLATFVNKVREKMENWSF